MTRTSPRDTLLRWLPFIASAVYSIAMSAVAPLGRHAFHFDWSLGADTLALSLTKLPHIGTAALVALLAIWATGRQRWLLALILTVAVGGGWELAQTTVIGHEARLADLLPDTMGALLGCAWGACGLWLLEPWRREGSLS
jgi:hypothetical protein